MKRLVIIRHAKTEQENYDRDYTRQLLPIGINDAKNIANDLKERKIFPDSIISSSAVRALATAHIFAEKLGFQVDDISEEKVLYFEITPDGFIDMVQGTNNNIDTLFVIGHNPFMHIIAQRLSANYNGHMPTCSTVVFDFDIDNWNEVEPGKGTLFLHLYPSLYK